VTAKNSEKPVLFLGDACESIDGRNMGMVSSRRARIGSFLSGFTRRDLKINPATPEAFVRWQQNKQQSLIRSISQSIAQQEPEFAVESINYNLRDLLSRGNSPA